MGKFLNIVTISQFSVYQKVLQNFKSILAICEFKQLNILQPRSDVPHTSGEYDNKLKQDMAEAYMSMVKSQPMPTASAKVLLRTTIHTGPQGLPPSKPRKPRTIIPFETVMGKNDSFQRFC